MMGQPFRQSGSMPPNATKAIKTNYQIWKKKHNWARSSSGRRKNYPTFI